MATLSVSWTLLPLGMKFVEVGGVLLQYEGKSCCRWREKETDTVKLRFKTTTTYFENMAWCPHRDSGVRENLRLTGFDRGSPLSVTVILPINSE